VFGRARLCAAGELTTNGQQPELPAGSPTRRSGGSIIIAMPPVHADGEAAPTACSMLGQNQCRGVPHRRGFCTEGQNLNSQGACGSMDIA